MFTTAGAARATASAKLSRTTVGALGAVATGAGSGFAAGAGLNAPSSAGFHHTTRKATASPTATAFDRNFNTARKRCNCGLPVRPEGLPDPSNYDVLCIMRPVLRYTNIGPAAADAKIWQSF